MKVTKKTILMDNESKRRIDSICKFHNAKPIYFNGGVRFIDNTNLYYLEPNRIYIKGVIFLYFNYCEYIYIKTLDNKIKLSDLGKYLDTLK